MLFLNVVQTAFNFRWIVNTINEKDYTETILNLYLSNMTLEFFRFWIPHRIIKATQSNSVNENENERKKITQN